MADEVSDLRLFTRIVAAGSLSEAARRASTSLTSVSRRLSGLEDRLGVRLIDRGSRKFTLTEEGLLLHERAVPIVDALDAVTAELSARSGPPSGLLRVSAPHEIGRRQISGLCRAFSERHPRMRVELNLTDARPDILETELDVAIQTKRPTEGDVVYRKLLSSRRVICAAPSYLLTRGRPEKPEDLAHHNCLCVTRGTRIYDQWTVRGPQVPAKVVVSGSLTSNSTDTIHRWALDGAGVAIKALWDIEDDLRAGRLVELLPDYACDDIHLYATHFTRRHVPTRIRAFIDFLVEHLPTQGVAGPEPYGFPRT